MNSTNIRTVFPEQRTSKGLQHSVSSKLIHHGPAAFTRKVEKRQITIKTSELEAECKQYEWRLKTQLPIIKILNYQVQESREAETNIVVEIQAYPMRLSELKELPLFKILYLIKESIIGFERLIDRMGSFDVNPKMIVFSQNHKCKVWFNECLASNSFQRSYISQRQFLQKLYEIFQVRTNKLRSTLGFFAELKKIHSFCHALIFIENYARENKISISNSCKINSNEVIVETVNEKVKPFDSSMTMSKAPNFIKNNNLKLTLSPKNHRLFDIVRKKCAQQDQQEHHISGNEKMKASDNTAADIYCSNTTSLVIKEDQVPQNLTFRGSKQTHSIMEPKLNSVFSRKYSTEASNYEIHCMTPTIALAKWEENHHFDSRNAQKVFMGDDSSDEESNPEKIKELFTTNRWNMSMKGLFEDDSPLRSSFVSGKQIRKTEYDGTKLHLLGNIGKQMTESHISQEFDL